MEIFFCHRIVIEGCICSSFLLFDHKIHGDDSPLIATVTFQDCLELLNNLLRSNPSNQVSSFTALLCCCGLLSTVFSQSVMYVMLDALR